MHFTSKDLLALLGLLTQPERGAEVFADLLIARFEARGLLTGGAVYTSTQLPPDVRSRERFNRLVSSCPGAEKRGRTWVVPRASWEEYRTRRRSEARTAAPVAATSEDAEADALLSAAGLRPSLKAISGGRR